MKIILIFIICGTIFNTKALIQMEELSKNELQKLAENKEKIIEKLKNIKIKKNEKEIFNLIKNSTKKIKMIKIISWSGIIIVSIDLFCEFYDCKKILKTKKGEEKCQ